jgi:hypothetical protein
MKGYTALDCEWQNEIPPRPVFLGGSRLYTEAEDEPAAIGKFRAFCEKQEILVRGTLRAVEIRDKECNYVPVF